MKIESKNNLKLVIKEKLTDEINLYTTEPFEYEGLNVTCSNCKEFRTQPIYFPSGECKKYTKTCGQGYACEDYENR